MIGATGTIGGHVTTRLLDTGVPVRAMTRDPAAARLPDGVEVVGGDLLAPNTVTTACEGWTPCS
ncbi:NAD(P)H-binding protein [Lentzea sp. BCCO 10_0856]|uniref:NAD(P)H-binding protein n=1 Tax=Lentzea miocenica TaxID=3095431 RepID=A0ABU4TCY3_9PSEU|nr:NAD(P)H-binding protein [Lentzea sp. BCCO 10_0856]MDX8036026.1 NAD(P)H-binding protein [Lentzea sp. BCCO 10_0856]